MGYCMGQMGLDVRDVQVGQNEQTEQPELAQDGRLPYEFMPVTNWGRKPNGAEMVQYDAPMFFSFTEHSLLHQYPNMRAECHWHIDFEFTHIIRGHMWYFVNGESIRLEEGQGIFVNSRQLHYGFTEDGTDCEFSCTLLNPSCMCMPNMVYERFVAPLMADERLPYMVCDPEDEHGSALLECMMRLHDAKFGQMPAAQTMHPATVDNMKLKDDTASLTVLSCFYTMVRELTAIAGEHGKNGSSKYDRKNPKIAILSKMIDYVQHNYVRQITLEEIASAGSVGRTKCAQIFHEMVDQTPIEFVNDVRMRAGAEMLDTTSMPVSDIAKNLVSHHRHSSRARSSSTCIRRPRPTGGICSSRPWTSYAIVMRLPQCWRRLLGQLRCGGGGQRRAGSPNASQGQAQTDERYREHCHQSG